jgi:hypothetical protein
MMITGDFTKKNANILISSLLILFFALFLSGCELKIPQLKELFNQPPEKTTKEYVKGLEAIPKYPNSEFMFKTKETAPEVKKLLASHNSAYRLLNDSKYEEAIAFYKKELKKSGWQFDHEVKLDNKTQKYGFYWTKGTRGLRIYEQINDIWYQALTAEEAKTGLAYLVALEAKEYYNPQNLIKLSSVTQTNWDFEFPDSWDVEQKNSSYSKGLDIIFKYSLGGFEIRIQDLSKNMGTSLDQVWLAYLAKINEGRDAEEKYELFVEHLDNSVGSESTVTVELPEVLEETGQTNVKPNPEPIKLGSLDALEMTLIKKDTNAKAYITFMKQPTTGSFYAIVNIIGDKEFYDYIKMTIKPL